ncbi:MAG: 1-acyl-sn-glycerol-3-phosphate acyltransferase [Spirochaetia bacterium]|jgi:1-acyl-sn-glycerol-3-phosphate acyltransferase|uniref:Phospholipid/glycerol acyltransferase domain-containing protein n=2 Tax=root TaxID=1 RepID=A0A644SXA3_9ZZZZ|nr:1-acyl-sn-glycerol-3-phosphate acyltransferase [Spirochaetia bacterium]MCE1210014.1 1-acyl-sn-glycerol-3-phosphate acyltransferase [Spirochaetia bacterium]NLX45191.1 1-acyl-sn-glycerol-3-phosphate acyltransferase [Treponema sp.]VBB41057.1 putative 1-acyl-sn-glycerol-3-phosphate acyltransferase [uncultured Spirochaetota bacterium]HOI22115.1 lysophospholipid acyltransferase family protein [Spirochaetales bacterium]
MISARRYSPTNSYFFTWILRHSYGAYICRVYKAKGIGLEVFDRVKPPFILVGNHSTLLDPFLTNNFVPHPIHWVSSDGNMRSPIMRFLLIKLVGSIPKSKAIPDIETVNWMVEFIRKRKGVVGLYPEGQSSWNGDSLPVFGSTAKLIRLLKAPVILAHSRGAYMTKPRWSYFRREGRMEIEFSELFSPEMLKDMSVKDIDEKLKTAISHDDPAWAQARRIAFRHPRRAESLELALFACPACGALHSIASKNEQVFCRRCGFSAEYGEDGSFRLLGKGDSPTGFDFGIKPVSGELLFESLKTWDLWQKTYLEQRIARDFLVNPEQPIFSDERVSLLRGKRMDTMDLQGKGRLSLNSRYLLLRQPGGREVKIEVADIDGPGVLKWNFFEFYVGKTVYRARFDDKTASGYKYAMALEALAALRKAAGAKET